jgi:hypothetical protein
MTRIAHTTHSNYHHRFPTDTLATQPNPQAAHQLQIAMKASEDNAVTPTLKDHAKLLKSVLSHPSTRTLLADFSQRRLKTLTDQGRQGARDLMNDSHVKADKVMNVFAKYRDYPAVLAGFFEALGPHNTVNALRYVDYKARDVIGSQAFTQLADRDDTSLGELNRIKAWRHEQRNELREILAEALSKGAEGGLSDAFVQGMAKVASADPKTANQLSNILSQSDDEGLTPLKTAFLNTLMTADKALSEVSDTDTPRWVRAATLLLGSDTSSQLAESLQRKAGSSELTYFISNAVQHSAKATPGLDGLPYYDQYYQQGVDGLLRGLSQLQGDEYTKLKAHVFSAANDAMGEQYTRKGLTEGLKALFTSDAKGIAIEVQNASENDIQSLSAFAYFFKETIFDYPDSESQFLEAVSTTLKSLYQSATDDSIDETENELNARALGLMFGNLQAAFEVAKADNQMNQNAVQNTINILTGFATIYPHLSRQIGALKDGAIVPFFDALLNGKRRRQTQDIDLIDTIFGKLEGAILAGFNGYLEHTGRTSRDVYDLASAKAVSSSRKDLFKN